MMNNKAKQYFARVAIENVFREDPTYLCDHLFGGDWVKMYEYITGKLIHSISDYFPDQSWTEIAPDWTYDDYKKNRISMCGRWEEYDMSYALNETWDDAYRAVRDALESGITLEDLKMFWVKDNKTTLDFVQDERTITATFRSEELKNHIVLAAEQVKLIRDELDGWLARNGYDK